MGLKSGDWVELPDLSVAKVSGSSEGTDIVKAEVVTGKTVARPSSYATSRWRRLPEDGLRVAWALRPDDVTREASDDPVGVVVRALRDEGGLASTRDLKGGLQRVMAASVFAAWWKRTQRKLEDDPRVDTSEALQHRYRLVAEGQRPATRLRPLVSGRVRAGRRLADAHRLLDARERAKQKAGLTPQEEENLQAVADLARDPAIEPTDRFMAGEIRVLLAKSDEAELSVVLGTDLMNINVLRIREHESRTRVLRLAQSTLTLGSTLDIVPTLASSVAAGGEWRKRAVELAEEHGVPLLAALGWGLSWDVPGSDIAAEVNYPDDLRRYSRRWPSYRPTLHWLTVRAFRRSQPMLFGP